MDTLTEKQNRIDSEANPLNVFSALFALIYGIGIATIFYVVWQSPSSHIIGGIGIAIAIALFLVQLYRFRSTYRAITAEAEENPRIATVLNTTKIVFFLGVLLFFLFANAVYIAFVRCGR